MNTHTRQRQERGDGEEIRRGRETRSRGKVRWGETDGKRGKGRKQEETTERLEKEREGKREEGQRSF